MQNILASTSKTSSVRVLFWRFFLATLILLLSHTPGLAQDSGASEATTHSPMTKKERWSQYLNDNFAGQGPYFRAFGASLGDSTANKPAEWGGPVERYSLNFAAQFARFSIAGTVQSSMAAAFGCDTRYHHCDCKGAENRPCPLPNFRDLRFIPPEEV